jgi:ATP-dependent DNA helicase RecG
LPGPLEGLRKVLALERQKKFADAAVVGGLDAYLLRFVQDNDIGHSHPVSKVIQSLPPGGYRALHKIQRQRVVDELIKAAVNGVDEPSVKAPEPVRRPAKVLDFPKASATKTPVAKPPPSEPARVLGTPDSPVSVLGVTKSAGEKLASLRPPVRTVRQLLYHLPSRYHDYSEARKIAHLQYGEEQTVVGKISVVSGGMVSRYKKGTEAVLEDETGSLRVMWWGQPWRARQLKPGQTVALSGIVKSYRNRLQMENPELEEIDDEALKNRRLVPVYPTTEGLLQRNLRLLIRQAVESFAGRLEETLPKDVRNRAKLMPIGEAVRQIHAPDSPEMAEAARQRLAFEELLYIEIGVVRRRKEWQAAGGAPRLLLPDEAFEAFLASLPFSLTADQSAAISAILADAGREVPMARLLEGDVGSGKTVVAAAALLAAVHSGYQGAIMAPTEILAEQHFRTFSRILSPNAEAGQTDGPWFDQQAPGYLTLDTPYMPRPVRVALLTGSLRATEKQAAQRAIAAGEVDIAVGTHALLQEGVAFERLGLAVIDEQHRFGVEQRAALRGKGGNPHILVMTATPIPRTLALTVYGDLDITVLKEMPPGRPPVKTYRVLPYRRQEAFDFVEKKIAEGRQAYVICPLVEESESIEAKAAVQEYERLRRDVFPDLRLGLLHGRMTPSEKDKVMREFRDHEIDILVSTSVVEVGVDVPNATVILIEGADRFGLSQLHQFRGRVRRSEMQATCFLLSENPSPESEERLVAMETTDNGFELAEKDMELRGPGEYFGTRQSGMPDLRVAKLTDVALIEQTRAEATRLLEADPELASAENSELREQVVKVWERLTGDVS